MENNIKILFGKKVAELRKERGISQEELGYKAKIHRTYISEIERGIANITLEQIQKLAEALDVDLPSLFKF